MSEEPIAEPLEQLPIPLFDGVVLAVRGKDGRIFLSLRDLCDVLGLEVSGQRRRIRRTDRLTLLSFRTQLDFSAPSWYTVARLS